MASSTKRFIIAFLCVDLIVSAGFLAYAALFHSAQNMTKESIISNDINIINPTVNSGERKNTKRRTKTNEKCEERVVTPDRSIPQI